jgi:hypothetical protein
MTPESMEEALEGLRSRFEASVEEVAGARGAAGLGDPVEARLQRRSPVFAARVLGSREALLRALHEEASEELPAPAPAAVGRGKGRPGPTCRMLGR